MKRLDEMHLYNDKMEYFIKWTIWMLSFIMVLTNLPAAFKGAKTLPLASSCLIFSLSLAMEFVGKLLKRKGLLISIVRTIFCGLLIIATTLSFTTLIQMFVCLIKDIVMVSSLGIIMLYMIIDGLLCIFFDNNEGVQNSSNIEENDKTETRSLEEIIIDCFNNRLIGNVNENNEGENNNE